MEWRKLPQFNVKNAATPLINEEIDLTPEEIQCELKDESKKKLIERMMRWSIL